MTFSKAHYFSFDNFLELKSFLFKSKSIYDTIVCTNLVMKKFGLEANRKKQKRSTLNAGTSRIKSIFTKFSKQYNK